MNDHLYVDRAPAYAEHAERSPYNASYERPSMLDLVGDIADKDVMDVGCGAAPRLERRARIRVHDVRQIRTDASSLRNIGRRSGSTCRAIIAR